MERTARSSKLEIVLVALYLSAIVIANLAVAHFGPVALLFSALLLIPFDLCTRDVLHERWQGRRLALRMALLIVSGSLLSLALSPASARVATASCAAFAVAACIDTIVYQLAHRLPRFHKMNLSNLCSSITDSLIFPVVAFGSTTWALSGSQSAAKFGGGIFWSYLFVKLLRRRRLNSEQKPVWSKAETMGHGG